LAAGNLILGETTSANAQVDGIASVLAQAGIGSSDPSPLGLSAIAAIDGAPAANIVGQDLVGAPDTEALLDASGTAVLAAGMLGGAHSASGTGAETFTVSTGITLNVLQLADRQDLFLAFNPDTASNSGVSDVSLNISVGSTSLLKTSLASAAAVTNSFTDHLIDLGSLSSGLLAANPVLDLQVALSVTTIQAGGSFDVQFLLGTTSTPLPGSLYSVS
jgi:hypothetical protein